jgi:3-isopropylmalate/(R)-2-methylmalate dehydratase small subunit
MDKVTTITSKVVPIPMKDVDTDMIIPAQFLTSISREGYGQNLFRRFKDQDPNFPLTQKKYAGAQIIVVDSNFGCGSSREHAVWALTGAGIRAIIAKSFADIFYNNSAKNGLLLVVLPADQVDKIIHAAESSDYNITIDLESQKVKLPDGSSLSFDYDPFRRHCMLNGLDDIDYILSNKAEIEKFRAEQKRARDFSTLSAAL